MPAGPPENLKPPSESHWYVVETKPQKEDIASVYLNSLPGVISYLPTADKKPFFGNYLFIRCNVNEVGLPNLRFGLGLKGGIIAVGDEPVIISDEVITKIKQRLSNLSYLDSKDLPLGLNDDVFIIKGPFKGYVGSIYELRSKKIVVTIQSGSQLKKIELDPRDVKYF